MKKEERIRRYGEATYEKKVLQQRQNWSESHPNEVIAHHREQARKGGKHYQKYLEYSQTGLRGERERIRMKHRRKWTPYKQIVAPNSQLHHQWLPGTADYAGVALVEADQHTHGSINVIQVLEGKITLFTETDIRGAS